MKRFLAPVVMLTLLLAPSAARADEASTPEPVIQYLPGPLPSSPVEPASVVVDYAAAVRYVEALRQLPPDRLIDLAFEGTGAAPRMKAIARRESGLGRGTPVPFDAACSAANRRSSARGLFQTLRSVWKPFAETPDDPLTPKIEGAGVSWVEVEGPDCLADVILARAIWARSGFGPWS
jgi:hypothetical protein